MLSLLSVTLITWEAFENTDSKSPPRSLVSRSPDGTGKGRTHPKAGSTLQRLHKSAHSGLCLLLSPPPPLPAIPEGLHELGFLSKATSEKALISGLCRSQRARSVAVGNMHDCVTLQRTTFPLPQFIYSLSHSANPAPLCHTLLVCPLQPRDSASHSLRNRDEMQVVISEPGTGPQGLHSYKLPDNAEAVQESLKELVI